MGSYEGNDEYINLYSNPILGTEGIEKREIHYTGGIEYIATHPRALADLVYMAIKDGKDINVYQKDSQDLLTDEECREYWKYLRKLAESYNEIDEFSKIEFPKWYLEECCVENEKGTEKEQIEDKNIEILNIKDLETLKEQKIIALLRRNKIRDFFDVGMLLQKYPEIFSNSRLRDLKTEMDYSGLDNLSDLLKIEIREHKLKEMDAEKFVLDIYELIEDKLYGKSTNLFWG